MTSSSSMANRVGPIVALVLAVLAVLIGFGSLALSGAFAGHSSRALLATFVATTSAHAMSAAVLAAAAAVLITALRRGQPHLPLSIGVGAVAGLLAGIVFGAIGVLVVRVAVGPAFLHLLIVLIAGALGGLVVLIRPSRVVTAGVLAAAVITLVLLVFSVVNGFVSSLLISAGHLRAAVAGLIASGLSAVECVVVVALAVAPVVWLLVRSGEVERQEVRAGALTGVVVTALRMVTAVLGVVPAGFTAAVVRDSFSQSVLFTTSINVAYAVLISAVAILTGWIVAAVARPKRPATAVAGQP
ncbi:hypothetical protein [Fodinicola acaciae]|uniref:hypothetical protein n=1 Tax=Fodinicola acaciae TaxID=2681555 RepID=UPI0013D3F7E3|nr:hypothetical protein [Fodinicola acaciae]